MVMVFFFVFSSILSLKSIPHFPMDDSVLVLPPLIIPGGGRFAGVFVSIRPQSPVPSGSVIRWQFSMYPPGRRHLENGPTIEGRLPAREAYPYESCYEFSPQKMGYRRSLGTPDQVLSLQIPGTYQVFAWIEDPKGESVSRSQFCAFEVVLPAASMGA